MKTLTTLLIFLCTACAALGQAPVDVPHVKALPGQPCNVGDIVSLIITDSLGNLPGLYRVSSAGPPCTWVSVGSTGVTFPVNPNTGQAVSPLNLGQVADTQIWSPIPVSLPALSQSNSGGSLINGHTIRVKYTYSSALGETRPSTEVSISTGAGCGAGTCSVTITGPTLPLGYTGWTAYVSDNGAANSELKLAACTNLGSGVNCVVQTGGAGAATPTQNTSIIQPPGTIVRHCPDPANGFWFGQTDTTPTWQEIATMDLNHAAPPAVAGHLKFCYSPIYFDDTQLLNGCILNAAFSFCHESGNGGNVSATLIDPTIGWVWDNSFTQVAPNYEQLLGIYGELHVANNSTTCAPVGGEDCSTAIRAVWTDIRTAGTLSSGGNANGAIDGTAFINNTISGPYSSCAPCVVGVQGNVHNLQASAKGSMTMAGLAGRASDDTGSATALTGIAVFANSPVTRAATNNFGFFAADFGANVNDYSLRINASTENTAHALMAGNTYLEHVSAANLVATFGFTPPTCTATGVGTGSCAIRAGSTDSMGRIVMTVSGGTGAATGTAVLNFHLPFVAPVTDVSCNFTPQDNTGAWAANVGMKITAHSLSSITLSWSNGSAAAPALANGTYDLNYQCWGN